MGISESRISNPQLSPELARVQLMRAGLKSAESVKRAFENNVFFKRVDNGYKIRPRTLKNCVVELLYDGGKGKICFTIGE